MLSPIIKELFNVVASLFRKGVTTSEEYENWKSLYLYLHGDWSTQKNKQIEALKTAYDVEISTYEDAMYLMYCIEWGYTLFLRLVAHNAVFKGITTIEPLEIISCRPINSTGIINFIPINVFSNLDKKIDKNFIPSLLLALRKTQMLPKDIDTVFCSLFPSSVRHSLGEYYTQEWVAKHILEQVFNYKKSIGRILDPTCGSGTFLIESIRIGKKRKQDIHIAGIDINPTSVMAAKVKVLIEFEGELPNRYQGIVPVFCADIVNNPYLHSTDSLDLFTEAPSHSPVDIPQDCETFWNKYKSVYVSACSAKFAATEEINRFERIAPRFINDYDVVCGNPPWVNWEYLPKNYRNDTIPLWQKYKLFDNKGMNSVFAKEDISVLVTYLSADKFLAQGGILAFLLKESLIKSTKQAKGFRKFIIAPSQLRLSPFRIDDLSSAKVFPDVSISVVAFFAQKNKTIEFPIDYFKWNSSKSTLSGTPKEYRVRMLKAKPLNQDIGAPLMTFDPDDASVDKYIGRNLYKARIGVFTGGANGLFWVNILEKLANGNILVETIIERAKNVFPVQRFEIEPDLVRPLITGRDLSGTKFGHTKYIVFPHTLESKMSPIDELELSKYPCASAYFNKNKKYLVSRKGFTAFDKHIHALKFWSLQRVGDYTFAKYKVAWKYIASSFAISVIEEIRDTFLGSTNCIPSEKVVYVGTNDKREAFYLAGVLNSSQIKKLILSHTISTQLGPGILENIRIPQYVGSTEQNSISDLAIKANSIDEPEIYIKILNQIDGEVDALYSTNC